jgi:proteasome accessory factor B
MRMSGTKLATRTERLTIIEQMLFHNPIGLRAVELADACGVDRRTIYRDLSMLNDIGIPIEQKDGRFFINRNKYTATTRLTFDEAMALYLAARIASHFEDRHNVHIDSALQKVGLAMPLALQAHIVDLVESDQQPTIDLQYHRVMETVTRAWSERIKVRLWTTSGRDGKVKTRDFLPYFIEPNESGVMCAVGFDSATQQVRAFKLTRILRARLTNVPYQIPEQFDVAHYLLSGWAHLSNDDDSLVNVVLVFTPEAALQLRDRPWQGDHHYDVLPDNSVKLVLRVADWHDLLPWIRSWGSQVEVLEPPQLRQEIAYEAARMEARYRTAARTR